VISRISETGTDERMNKMWSVYTMEYHAVFKKKETLSHATTWMNLKDIMLNEVSQS